MLHQKSYNVGFAPKSPVAENQFGGISLTHEGMLAIIFYSEKPDYLYTTLIYLIPIRKISGKSLRNSIKHCYQQFISNTIHPSWLCCVGFNLLDLFGNRMVSTTKGYLRNLIPILIFMGSKLWFSIVPIFLKQFTAQKISILEIYFFLSDLCKNQLTHHFIPSSCLRFVNGVNLKRLRE